MTRVWEVGHGDRAVLLIHDVFLRADWWRLNLRGLADGGLRAISFDLPGHGFADKDSRASHKMPQWVEFVSSFIDGLRLERPILVGAGTGAEIAARVALSRPDGTAGTVMCSPMGLVAEELTTIDEMCSIMEGTTRESSQRRVKEMLEGPLDPEWVEEEYRIASSPGSAEVFGSIAAGLRATAEPAWLRRHLHELTRIAPAAIMVGTHDHLTPPDEVRAVLNTIGVAVPIRTLEGGGHAVYHDCPNEFNAAVIDFANSGGAS